MIDGRGTPAGSQRPIKEDRMSDKRGDGATKALGAAAAFVAAFVARKVITVGWKRLTGKEPPSDPQDPRVGTGEAVGYAVLMGVVMGATRVLAIRAATARMRRAPAEPVEPIEPAK
jgi:hypothetical protein